MTQITQSVVVVGAGQMGRGIAQVAASAGFNVLLCDASTEALQFSLDFIKKQLSKGLEKGKWNQTFIDETLSRLKVSPDLAKASD